MNHFCVCSRKEPSALNRAQSQSPSPVSSPDQPAVRPAPHGQQSAHADMRQGQNVSLQDVVRISSHFVPMEESNYVDVLAIKVFIAYQR